MKKMIWVLISVALLAACNQKKQGPFVVSGKITNLPATKIFLEQLPFTSNQPVVVDSATLKPGGAYQLKSMAKEEGLYRLTFDNGPQVILINDDSDIHISLDGKTYTKPEIKGSDATKSLYTFFDEYGQRASALNATYREKDSLMRISGNDSLPSILDTRMETELKVLNGVAKRFIENTSSATAAYYSLLLSSETMQKEEVMSLVNALAAKHKEHAGLAKLKTIIAMQNQQQPQPYSLLNQQAPDLKMQDVNGKMLSISSFKGKYVLVDFWASWCGPCRQENPNVVTAFNKFKNKNFTILGVSLDQDKNAWLAAIKKDNLTWNHMSDLKYWESAAVDSYKFQGIPFNVLIDPSGKIIANDRGQALEQKLAEVIQ